MVELGSAAVEAGAFGMSTGLIYPPGLFSDTDEIVEVMQGLPEGAIYATHMRGEGAHLRRSIAEALEVGRRSGAPVQISHLKSAGRQNWGGVAGALELIEDARADGVRVTQDVYPYTASSTMLTACLPPWCQEGGNPAVLERLADTEQLRRLRDEIEGGPSEEWENHVAGAGWDGILVSSTGSHSYEGQTLAELAEELGGSPFEALVTVLTQEQLRASMVVFSMCEDDLELALRDPFTMIGSDGLPPGVGGKPHPRLFGTFPRVLARYVRERATLDLATAVQKMTGLPADTFGLHDRGYVAPGRVADLVAFTGATVADHGDYRDPVHPPTGLAWVMQAGAVVVDNGRWLGLRRGRRLTPGSAGRC
jgi:N-acyl-D-amino-acid deacylase